jgi:hypothetical protein
VSRVGTSVGWQSQGHPGIMWDVHGSTGSL